jgi:aldose sugar dehydrogenase
VYLYYTVPGTLGVAPTPPKHPDARRGDVDGLPTEGVMRLSRFVLGEDNRLDLAGEEVLFENPAIFDNRTFARDCCHQAGDLDWLPDGTLLLAIGDDTNPFESDNFTPIDERPGRDAFNAQLTSANPADRRGKVLRLDVQNLDGEPGLGDMIPNDPEGPIAPNPHVDDPRYDPAVYAMGFRNPYRIAVDEETGTVIVGNFNPDATAADPQRGPEGFTEVDTVPPGGGTDHGWPYCIADNRPYIDYDFATGVSGEAFECTGIDGEPYHEPDLYYSYGPSAQHPTLAVGTVGPMPGVVYDYDGDGAYRLPGRIHGQLVFLEWSRMAAYTIPVGDVDGDGESELGTAPTDVVPLAISLANPIDAAIGPDGAVYVAEFGRAYGNNPDSAISRIRCAACLPDPTDYGMAEDATLFVGHRTALTGGEATDAAADDARARLSLQAVAGAALVGLALLPLRRRRDVL